MKKVDWHPMHDLAAFLPPGAFEPVAAYLHKYKVSLTITHHRRSILGDYRNATQNSSHRISVNGSLNPYAFLITLLHELAHLLTFEQYKHTVPPHGKEWKHFYKQLLNIFIELKIFPPDLNIAIQTSLQQVSAATCSDEILVRALRVYDKRKQAEWKLVENIATGSFFKTSDGRVFQKGARLKKRFRCTELNSGKIYLFSPVYEVQLLSSEEIS